MPRNQDCSKSTSLSRECDVVADWLSPSLHVCLPDQPGNTGNCSCHMTKCWSGDENSPMQTKGKQINIMYNINISRPYCGWESKTYGVSLSSFCS